MRVLFFNDLGDPGLGSSMRLMYSQAARLRELGHETAVACATQKPGEIGWTEIEGCRVFRILSDYSPRWRGWVGIDNPRVREPMRKLLAEWKPDVVHAHIVHTHLSYGSLRQAREAGAAVVFTAHDVMTFCYQKLTCYHGGEAAGGKERDYPARFSKCLPCQRFRFRPGRNAAIRRYLERDVHRLTVVSDELGRAISANGIRVDGTLPNALRLQERLPTAEAIAEFRRRRGLDGKLLIAIGGRLHEQKGVVQLLKMIALLGDEFPELRLLVMGREDFYRTYFEGHAIELGVADRVVPTGWLDGEELQCAYGATDVSVYPSICFDTFGMVSLEAMEHRKPVVATEFGGCPEVVADGVTGAIANPFDIPAFAEKIAELLRDEELRRTRGEAGYQRLLELFTIERNVDLSLEEYDRGVARAREGGRGRGGRGGT